MNGRKILIGVSGGIAAFKTAALVSRLVQEGALVSVVMTESAHQFIGVATFEALTGRRVPSGVFDRDASPLGAHIDLAERAELFCIAPATANVLAKAAHGLADDLLSTLMLSCSCPLMFAPAMNCDMWEKPSVARNVATLRKDGHHIIDPEAGWLSCRKQGVGRMADPETLFASIADILKTT